METLLSLILGTVLLAIAYEVGKYAGLRDAEKLFKHNEKEN